MEPFVKTTEGKNLFQICLTSPYILQSPLFGSDEFVALLICNDPNIGDDNRDAICKALLAAGCRYAVCTGINCSAWEDAFDWAYLESNEFCVENQKLMMTTSHDHESAEEVASFFLNCTSIGDSSFENYLVISVGACMVEMETFAHALRRI